VYLQVHRGLGGLSVNSWPANDLLLRLQKWFSSQCNGTWEHQRGVSIESTDNPGWWIKINIAGTDLEDCEFEEVRVGMGDDSDPQPPWMRCYIKDGVWNGAGDFTRLPEIVDRFLSWAGFDK